MKMNKKKLYFSFHVCRYYNHSRAMDVKNVKKTATKYHIILLLVVVAFFIWSAIKPVGYRIWTLEVIPAVLGLIIVLVAYKRLQLTTLSYFIIAILSIFTFIGGHYTYSEVPLFDWLKDKYHLERNHYDRFGHFLKGFLVIVIREILLRTSPLKKGKWLTTLSLSVVLAIAALYEIIEWLFSKITGGGKASKDFLGTQGDIWDSQWDMTLTLVGAMIALLLFAKVHNKILKKVMKD
jgi:putative membrane protein